MRPRHGTLSRAGFRAAQRSGLPMRAHRHHDWIRAATDRGASAMSLFRRRKRPTAFHVGAGPLRLRPPSSSASTSSPYSIRRATARRLAFSGSTRGSMRPTSHRRLELAFAWPRRSPEVTRALAEQGNLGPFLGDRSEPIFNAMALGPPRLFTASDETEQCGFLIAGLSGASGFAIAERTLLNLKARSARAVP